MSLRIFIALSTFADYDSAPLDLLRRSPFEVVLNPLRRRLTRDEVVELAAGAVGVVAGVEPYDAGVIERLPALRCISRCGAGTDNIALDAAARRGIIVCNTPAVVIEPVAELTVGMMLDLLRGLSMHTVWMRARRWEKRAGRLLAGSTVGIIGLGRIGRRVSELVLAFGGGVIGADPAADPAWADARGVEIVGLDDLLARADIVSLHLSIRPDAPFRVDAGVIARMRRGALLINVARGTLVDEDALYRALIDGRLGGAALDVFPEEPYRGALCDLENVVLTPHLATLTVESRTTMELEAARNLLDALASLPAH